MDRRDGLRPMVVGVDGSDQALRAVRWGVRSDLRGAGNRNLEEGGDRGAL